MARLRTTRLDYGAAKAMSAISKDADMSPFNACAKLLESRSIGATANPPRCVHVCVWQLFESLVCWCVCMLYECLL